MSFRRLLTVVALAAVQLFPGSRAIAAAAGPAHVRGSLVAADATIQPGQPVTVALRLVHEPHWHTYWLNPGTGLPTSLAWKLPPGWTAGPIQWPAPMVLKDKKGNVVGNGYEGELFLPVVLTPPTDLKPGTGVELKADADWLMCADVCIPGHATVALTLPVSAGAPPPDPTYGAKIRATIAGLPRADAAWKVTATRSTKTVTLTITPAQPGGHTPKNVHFFADTDFIAYDLPQTVKTDGRGGFVLTAPIAPAATTQPAQLLGVLTADNGWLPGNSLRGLRVATEFTGPIRTDTPASVAAAGTNGGGLPGTLFLAFLGGLILNLMPCVFPVLGIKILGFVNQAGQQRSRIVAHGLTFTGGVLISFWLLAGALAVLRAGGEQLGWGFQLQSAGFVYALTVLLLVFGMNMSGVFEFGLGATSAVSNAPWVQEQQQKSGYADSFLTGVLATAVATPCSAPFLAPALGAALAVPAIESFAIFTVIALGLSTPYLLLSVFPQAVRVLPRPGAWMETFKQFMAFPLYATVGYLVWVLAAQTSEEGFRGVLFSLVLIAMAVWIYGRWNAPGASPARARFGVIGLVVVGAVGLWLGWPRDPQAQTAKPGEVAPVVWEAWSPETVAKLRAEGRTIYVDFTARWCATCQTNKKLVFGSDEVLKTFAAKQVATLRADWTNKDPRITAELAAYQRSAVPFNVIWKPGQDAPVILPELLTPGIVLEAVK